MWIVSLSTARLDERAKDERSRQAKKSDEVAGRMQMSVCTRRFLSNWHETQKYNFYPFLIALCCASRECVVSCFTSHLETEEKPQYGARFNDEAEEQQEDSRNLLLRRSSGLLCVELGAKRWRRIRMFVEGFRSLYILLIPNICLNLIHIHIGNGSVSLAE